MFLSELLQEYGSPLDTMEGDGVLATEAGECEVRWAMAQYPDGQVLLACRADADGLMLLSAPVEIRGETASGVLIKSQKFFGELPLLRPIPEEVSASYALYRVSLLHANLPASGPPGSVRHLLTNFEFDAAERRSGMRFELPGVSGEVRLTPVESDPFASERLRTRRTAHPTAWLEILPQQESAVQARYIANDICNLLSIARGTKVAWIQEEIRSDVGEPTHRFYSHRVTKSYSPYAPLDPVRIGGTAAFLRQSYAAYTRDKDRWRLDSGTIDAILDAKTEADFLEMRGAKMAVALETLKQHVLLGSDPEVAFHVPPESFEKQLDELAKCAEKALTSGGVSADVASSMTTPARFLGLNRRSFASLLKQTCRKIDLKLSRRKLDLFVQCRNSLVHRGGFYCSTATKAERARVQPLASKYEEYLYLISIVDAFLLRLVGYRGAYAVRVSGSRWEERTV